MTAQRLASGGRINRNKIINFTWDKRKMQGFQGDTLASALLANNERIVGRSFKYHRPRGIMSSGVEESGALVTLGEGPRLDPNAKATTQELYEGLRARGQNAWPNVRFDLGSIANLFSQFFAAGFYYKTFMGFPLLGLGTGTKMWMFFEKFIRQAAGMGSVSKYPDPDKYEHGHIFCDIVVVGSGPAGLSAAANLIESGFDVLLVEQDYEIGGDYLNQTGDHPNFVEFLSRIKESNTRVMTRTTAFGIYDNTTLALLERVTDHLSSPSPNMPRERFWTVRSDFIVIATGALERTFAFGNNDMPGVMTTNAAKTYLNRFGVLAGKEIILSTNNDSSYETAIGLSKAGANVKILDARDNLTSEFSEKARHANIELTSSSVVLNAKGRGFISSIQAGKSLDNYWTKSDCKTCDLLLVSGGWSPVINLTSQRGSKPSWDDEQSCFFPGNLDEPIAVAGSAAGIWEMTQCEASGKAVSSIAANALGKSKKIIQCPKPGGWSNRIRPIYEVNSPHKKGKCFIDFQHDVTADDVRLANQEGFVSVELLKRYTTLGMAIDQGKMGNILGMGIMSESLGKRIDEVGTTTFRPPYTPVSLGALSGRNTRDHFRPLRRTPMDKWNLEHGAKMTDAASWRRPWFYPREKENIFEAYVREAKTVRETAGLCDVTSLGKISVQGPDAAEFLNRIYTNPFAKLAVGKARYGIMLRDDGMIMDDGTTWRLADNNYFMTTTTANAGKVMVWLEELLQTRWNDLKVHVASVSEQWAGCAVAGPLSRKILEKTVADPQLVSNENLPFMGVIETRLKNGIPSRIARISFSGEMASEIYVPSDYGSVMMDLLWDATKPLGGCLYGLEALGTLRIEKGHVTGAELDGRVTLEDAGLGKMASTKKSFVGNALRNRPAMHDKNRPRLAGIIPANQKDIFNAGSILCDSEDVSGHGEGWITASTFSPVFGHWIGLGFISGGYEKWKNSELIAADPLRNKKIRVRVISPHMYDADGTKHYG